MCVVYSENATLHSPGKPQVDGAALNFTCTGGLSNPMSLITWELGNKDITDTAKEYHVPGDYNATSVVSILEMNARREMNGQELKCIILYMYEAKPVATDNVILNILCK